MSETLALLISVLAALVIVAAAPGEESGALRLAHNVTGASSSYVPAVRAGPTPNSDGPNLNALIDAIQRRYSRMIGIGADFAQIYSEPDGRTIRESGHVLLKRPRKARWDYVRPERKVFLSDGKNIFFYVYGERQATKSAIKESVDPQVPFLFLLGQGNLRRGFASIEIDAKQEPVVAGDVVLRLVPKKAPDEFKQILVEVSPSTAEVRRLVILQRNGGAMDFYLSNIVENLNAPDSEFVFVPPPGVSVRPAD
jgi:chaperone LolA